MKLSWRSPLHFWSKRSWFTKGLFIILLLAIGGGYWWWIQQNKPEPVTTVQPEMRSLERTLEFTGVVDAQQKAQMRFAAGGRLVYLGAQEGEWVKRGQTLASLDQRSVQKNIEKTLNAYENERLDFENARDDREDRWLDTQEQRAAQKDQNALEQAVLDVELRSLSVQDYRLSSPIDGVLVQSPATVTGINLLATDVFEVIDPDTLVFELAVDEVDIDEVFEGQEAIVYLDARPDEAVAAQVIDVGLRSVQGATGTVFPVTLQFMESVELEEFRLGMNGEARLITGRRDNVLSVPISTLIFRNGTSYVEVQNQDGEVVDREVSVGLETEEYAEILSGLTLQDQVVLP